MDEVKGGLEIPKNAAKTVFSGVSVWAEVEAYSGLIEEICKQHELAVHPSHMTLVYNLPREGALDHFKELEAKLTGSGTVSMSPSHLHGGISRLFGHGYCDLFFTRNPSLDSLFETCMDVMKSEAHRESFAGAPHLCLGYACADYEPFASGAIKESILSHFPTLLRDSVTVTTVALWETEGTTSQWNRLASFQL